MKAKTPEDLLQASAAGDVAAFRMLYDLHARLLYGAALRITRKPWLAADAVQEAFLQIWRHAARFDPERGSAAGWMLAMVRYRALDIVRRAPPEAISLSGAEDGADPFEPPPDLAAIRDQGADAQSLLHCLSQLPPDRRDLIVAAFVNGYSHSELATRLKQPLGTIKSWIRRSLAGLRLCMEA
jgi:RNA polymerase sigma-70 factor (ECF subfamily)